VEKIDIAKSVIQSGGDCMHLGIKCSQCDFVHQCPGNAMDKVEMLKRYVQLWGTPDETITARRGDHLCHCEREQVINYGCKCGGR
jgi:hypothetical protein